MSSHLSLTKWCWAVTLWLASGFALVAHAQQPTGLAQLLDRYETAAALFEDKGAGNAFCSADQTEALTVAAAADDIVNPGDFVAALRLIWCSQGASEAQRLLALRARLPSQTKAKVRSRLLAQARDGSTFWYTPFYAFLGVSDDGKQIRVSTSRDGGGDEYEWRLVRGVWKLIRFEAGGAC